MSQPAQSEGSEGAQPPAGGAGERLGIAGAGTIGCALAVCAATCGSDVITWARSERSARRARDRLDDLCEKLDRPEAAARLTVTTALEDLGAASLAVEAVREDVYVKHEVLRPLGEILPEGALIASTTSSLRIAELARSCGRPELFFGLHVFNPVQRMDLVELCFPPEVRDDTRARAFAFCEAIGKTAVEVPDEPGFVVNRLLFPYLFDAVRLLERTGLEPAQIDACMKLGASHPMGPLELLDLIGIDVAEAIGEALHYDTGEPAHLPPGRVKQLVGEGRLGRKSGAGFYDYG